LNQISKCFPINVWKLFDFESMKLFELRKTNISFNVQIIIRFKNSFLTKELATHEFDRRLDLIGFNQHLVDNDIEINIYLLKVWIDKKTKVIQLKHNFYAIWHKYKILAQIVIKPLTIFCLSFFLKYKI
jgi:hypothetical protein